MHSLPYILFVYLETGPHGVTQADLIFVILLPPSPMRWYHRYASLHLSPTTCHLEKVYNVCYSVSAVHTVLMLYSLEKTAYPCSVHTHGQLDVEPPQREDWLHSCTHTPYTCMYVRMCVYARKSMSKFIRLQTSKSCSLLYVNNAMSVLRRRRKIISCCYVGVTTTFCLPRPKHYSLVYCICI